LGACRGDFLGDCLGDWLGVCFGVVLEEGDGVSSDLSVLSGAAAWLCATNSNPAKTANVTDAMRLRIRSVIAFASLRTS
jgi:hypothetical protein